MASQKTRSLEPGNSGFNLCVPKVAPVLEKIAQVLFPQQLIACDDNFAFFIALGAPQGSQGALDFALFHLRQGADTELPVGILGIVQ